MSEFLFKDLQNSEILFVSKASILTPGVANFHDFTEILYVLSGHGTYLIGENVYQLQPFDFVIINAHQLHHCVSVTSEEALSLFSVAVSLEKISPGNTPIQHTSPHLSEQLFPLISTMRYEWKYKNPYYQLKLLSCFYEFLVLVLRDTCVANDTSPQKNFSLSHKDQRLVTQALIYINKHYLETISLRQIASNTSVSPSHLNRLFQSATLTSPMQYVLRLRLKKACRLFSGQPGIPIREVAKSCGFSDPYHFSKLFKKHIGVTPSEYKNGKRASK